MVAMHRAAILDEFRYLEESAGTSPRLRLCPYLQPARTICLRSRRQPIGPVRHPVYVNHAWHCPIECLARG